ncbi:MAG: hypothetical protein NO076_01875, partial [Sulfolobales archaeon]|nr:hypothetical protein [Sulfolobales archaeon]
IRYRGIDKLRVNNYLSHHLRLALGCFSLCPSKKRNGTSLRKKSGTSGKKRNGKKKNGSVILNVYYKNNFCRVSVILRAFR